MRNALALTILPLLVLACERYPAGDATKEGRISVSTSALNGAHEACHTVQVRNSLGELLWTKDSICSSDGGTTFVGSCDAAHNPNEVRVLEVTIDGVPMTPRDASRSVTCVEDASTSVSFDLTTMQDAHTGFLDVDVSIHSIACSADFHCDADDGRAVLDFACTASPDAQAMRMSDITIDCDAPNGAVAFTLDPSQNTQDPLFQTAVYRTPGSSSTSWSVAITPNRDELASRGITACVLHASGTATKETDLVWSPRSNVYPYIDWSVPLTSDLTCGSHALGEPNSGVAMVSGDAKHTKTGHVTLMK